jgi:hypothetical protein
MKIFTSVVILLLLCSLSTPLSAADVTGRWTGQVVLGTAGKTIPFVLNLKLDGSALTGTFCFRDCGQDTQQIRDAKINGDAISFSVVTDASDLPRIDFQGTISGDAIKFALNGSPSDCPMASCQVGDGTATRVK